MKKILLSISLMSVCALQAVAQFAAPPAFPGAEGYGRYVTGARQDGMVEPDVYHVTTLVDDNQKGSLRYAIQRSGQRIIIFDVSGTIHLQSKLAITNDDITILGQTAPGDGICIADYPVSISANNVIIRYLRFRLGDVTATEDDAINACPGSARTGVIIDHCSVSWSTDECGSFYNNKQFSLQWCLLSESLTISVHEKGKHGYGGIWGGSTVSFHHNLLAHHDSRNPRFDHDYVSTLKGPVDFVNNVVYNWSGNSTYGGEASKGSQKQINMINNYYKPGPASSCKQRLIDLTHECSNCMSISGATSVRPGKFFLSGNYMEGSEAVTGDNWKGVERYGSETILASAKADAYQKTSETAYDLATATLLSIQPASVAFDNVVKYAGASFHRDAVDIRVAKETKEGTCGTYGKYSLPQTGAKGSQNGLIDTQSDVGGWPTLNTYDVLPDSDGDGMPDEFEDANGLGKYDATDATLVSLDTRGYYTNLEVYANQLVEAHIKAERAGAETTFEEYYPECIKSSNAATAVKNVVASAKGAKTNPYTYNLLGQRVNANVQGILINDGKKFFNP